MGERGSKADENVTLSSASQKQKQTPNNQENVQAVTKSFKAQKATKYSAKKNAVEK